MTEARIIADVLAELARAEQTYSWKENSLIKNALILSEEAGEVAQAVLNHDEGKGSIMDIRRELIQTAAMCFRNLKNL